MTRILVLEASFAPLERSASRRVTADLVARWSARDPDAVFIRRDLAADPLPHLDRDTFEGSFVPEGERSEAQSAGVARSQALIDELFSADVIIIGTPMYNFGVPSTLKAWIDHIAMAGKTFSYVEGRPQGLVTGKRVIVVASRGNVYSAGPAAPNNFQDTYLRATLGFMGMTDFSVIAVEGTKAPPEIGAKFVGLAEAALVDVLESHAGQGA
jgi:FMN-dependent NADH-azoreductase